MEDAVDTGTRAPTDTGCRMRKKRLSVDQDKLDRAVAILGASSEADAIDRALDFVLFQDDVTRGIERLAGTGGVENYFDTHPVW